MVKTALVTGANGFTGSNIVELLKKEGWAVVATDLKRETHKEYYSEAGELHPKFLSQPEVSLSPFGKLQPQFF